MWSINTKSMLLITEKNKMLLTFVVSLDNIGHLGKSRESSTAVTFHTLAVYCAGKVGQSPSLI